MTDIHKQVLILEFYLNLHLPEHLKTLTFLT